jgi:hypothetical protein
MCLLFFNSGIFHGTSTQGWLIRHTLNIPTEVLGPMAKTVIPISNKKEVDDAPFVSFIDICITHSESLGKWLTYNLREKTFFDGTGSIRGKLGNVFEGILSQFSEIGQGIEPFIRNFQDVLKKHSVPYNTQMGVST